MDQTVSALELVCVLALYVFIWHAARIDRGVQVASILLLVPFVGMMFEVGRFSYFVANHELATVLWIFGGGALLTYRLDEPSRLEKAFKLAERKRAIDRAKQRTEPPSEAKNEVVPKRHDV